MGKTTKSTTNAEVNLKIGKTTKSTNNAVVNIKTPRSQEEFKALLKQASIPLRKTGLDEDENPTMELGLILDITSSMSSWIRRAKDTLLEIIETVVKECQEDGDVKIRVCFVGYRDIKDAERFTLIPFTDDIQFVKKFIEQQKAEGGDDFAEDVQGGLKVCLHQDWTEEAVKRCILITDAPPHGKQFNEDFGDDYPNGSPEGLDLIELMKEYCAKDINFQVIKLNNYLDKMISEIKKVNQELEVTDLSHLPENSDQNYSDCDDDSGYCSDEPCPDGDDLLYDELEPTPECNELGMTPEDDSLFKNKDFTKSIRATPEVVDESFGMVMPRKRKMAKESLGMTLKSESATKAKSTNEDISRKFVIETSAGMVRDFRSRRDRKKM